MSDQRQTEAGTQPDAETPGWLAAQQRHDLRIRLPSAAALSTDLNQPLHPADSARSMLFVRIPGGRFRIGSRGYYTDEQPLCEVTVSDFYLGVFPVTQSQFAAWRKDHQNHFSGRGHGRHPAEQVSWPEAVSYCDWLTEQCVDQLPSGYFFCLPSECQWEYACRLHFDGAGVRGILESEYYTGDGESALSAAGWYDGNSGDTTHAVGALRGTTTGLYDLHGNVDEWCRDAWSEDSYARISWGQLDPEVRSSDVGASESDAQRVVRGGCWRNAPGI
ncbi:MAG: formylglycine-generating enzyme family protein, partial [Planctomycetaceae bacterium]